MKKRSAHNANATMPAAAPVATARTGNDGLPELLLPLLEPCAADPVVGVAAPEPSSVGLWATPRLTPAAVAPLTCAAAARKKPNPAPALETLVALSRI